MAWVVAPAVELSLRVAGLKRTLGWLERATPETLRRAAALEVDEAERVVGWAFRAHLLLRGACLERSLVQYAIHRLDGTPARFVIGVARDGEAIAGHAWIEDPDTPPRPREHAVIYRTAGPPDRDRPAG